MGRLMNRDSWLTVGVVGGSVLIYWYAIHLPSERMTQTVLSESAALQAKVRQMPSEVDRLIAEQRQLAECERQIDDYRQRFLHDASVTPVLAAIAEQTRAAGVRLVRVEPQPPGPQPVYVQHAFRLMLEGGFGRVTEVLRQIEAGTPEIHIEDLEMSSNGERSGAGEIGASVACEATFVVPAISRNFSDFDGSDATARRRTAELR